MLTNPLRALGTYLVAWTIGSIGGLLFWSLRLLGLIKIDDYWRLWRQVYKGNHIVAINHPTLLETMLMLCLWWPWCLIMPRKFFPWSAPATELFPWWLNWLYSVSNSIPIDRTDRRQRMCASQEMIRVLRAKRTANIHPEEGRTGSKPRGKRKSPKQFGVNPLNGRKLRRLESGIHKIAIAAGARITPVWVEIHFWENVNSFRDVIWTWFTSWLFWHGERYVITIHVGKTFVPRPEHTPHRHNKRLARKMLGAGQRWRRRH